MGFFKNFEAKCGGPWVVQTWYPMMPRVHCGSSGIPKQNMVSLPFQHGWSKKFRNWLRSDRYNFGSVFRVQIWINIKFPQTWSTHGHPVGSAGKALKAFESAEGVQLFAALGSVWGQLPILQILFALHFATGLSKCWIVLVSWSKYVNVWK